jgi:hypothetical protein
MAMMASGTQTQYQDRNPKAVTNGPTTVRLGAVVGAKAELGIGAGWHEGGSVGDGFGVVAITEVIPTDAS